MVSWNLDTGTLRFGVMKRTPQSSSENMTGSLGMDFLLELPPTLGIGHPNHPIVFLLLQDFQKSCKKRAANARCGHQRLWDFRISRVFRHGICVCLVGVCFLGNSSTPHDGG